MTAAPDAGIELGLVLDCADPDRLVGFWAAALGYEHAGTFGKYAMLMARDGTGRRLALQAVPNPSGTRTACTPTSSSMTPRP